MANELTQEELEQASKLILGISKLGTELLSLRSEVETLRRERSDAIVRVAELEELLEDVLFQACHHEGRLDSMALSAYAAGLRELGKLGRIKIEAEAGRRVIAQYREDSGI